MRFAWEIILKSMVLCNGCVKIKVLLSLLCKYYNSNLFGLVRYGKIYLKAHCILKNISIFPQKCLKVNLYFITNYLRYKTVIYDYFVNDTIRIMILAILENYLQIKFF